MSAEQPWLNDPVAGEAAPWANDPFVGGKTVRAKTKGKDGKPIYFDVAADANDETVQQAAMKATNDPRRRSVDRGNLPKDGSKARGLLLGAEKPLDKLSQLAMGIPGVAAFDKWAANATGTETVAELTGRRKDERANNSRTGYQTLGNIAGTLPTLALPGGALAQGAASGALLSDSDTLGGTAVDAATGALTGYGAGKVLGGAASLAKGVTDPALRALHKAGVPLTLGQIASAGKGALSRTVSKAEEALTAVPVLGDMIAVARERGVSGLNVAMGNRILGNVGETLPKGTAPGHAMIDAVQDKLSTRYKALVPNLRGTIDEKLATDLTAARDLADQASRGDQFTKVMERVLGKRVQGDRTGGTISGQMLKDAESELTRLYGKYKNAQGDEGLYGDAIDKARKALRDMILRSNPSNAKELQALNTGWAQLKSLRTAVKQGSDKTKASGVVTPGGALRVGARQGYRDPLLEAATKILPNTTPDSGTVRRGLASMGAIAGGTGALTVSPYLAVPAALSSLYTKPGMSALNAVAFGSRGAVGAVAAKQLENLSKYAPGVTVAATPYLLAKSNE